MAFCNTSDYSKRVLRAARTGQGRGRASPAPGPPRGRQSPGLRKASVAPPVDCCSWLLRLHPLAVTWPFKTAWPCPSSWHLAWLRWRIQDFFFTFFLSSGVNNSQHFLMQIGQTRWLQIRYLLLSLRMAVNIKAAKISLICVVCFPIAERVREWEKRGLIGISVAGNKEGWKVEQEENCSLAFCLLFSDPLSSKHCLLWRFRLITTSWTFKAKEKSARYDVS